MEITKIQDIIKEPEKIAEFHEAISPERFKQMQRNARDAYIHYFRIDALMHHIIREIEAQKAERS